MKTYKEFINEGVRDQMTPKSEEDIKSTMGEKKYHIYKSLSDAKESVKLPYTTTEINFEEISGRFTNYFGVNLRFLPFSVSYDGELWAVSYSYNHTIIKNHYNTWKETWDGILEFSNKSLKEEISTIENQISKYQISINELEDILNKINM